MYNDSSKQNILKKYCIELYNYRHVLKPLIIRNLKGRYSNSFLGIGWQILTPTIMVLLYYLVFSELRSDSDQYYWLYLCVGTFSFQYLQTNLNAGTACIISNAGFIKKMYFPRELVVLSQIIASLVPMLISFAGIITLEIIVGHPIGLKSIGLFLIFTAIMVLFTTGYTLLLSAIIVFIRDIHHLIQCISVALFWITPIFYKLSEISDSLNKIVLCNPFTYFVEAFHQILIDNSTPDENIILICIMLSLLLFIVGTLVFIILEKRFEDYL